MKFLSFLIVGFFVFSIASASLTSTSFELENPTNIISGGESTSSHFKYVSATSQISQGASTSTSFKQNTGFMYFPTASSPVLSATAGNTQVSLVWTASVGVLANITSYQLGVSTTSGGVFTYSSVGGVLNTIKTGLTNGTPYYFKVRSYASGLLLSESAEVTATPSASSSGGGGGGGGGGGDSETGVNFSGRAYPLSKVTILKDGQVAISTIAGPDSNFLVKLNGLASGNYTFSVYGEDKNGLRSSPFTFQVTITSGATTNIGGIFISPTIALDKSQVKKGDSIAIFGQSTPSAQVVISVHSGQEYFNNINSDASGAYLYNFDTSILELGSHSAKSKALKNGEISAFGDMASFLVGDTSILLDKSKKITKCDLNEDGRCNLIDFSIAAFWYKKPLSSLFITKEKDHLNGDGKIDLIDFSIMAYYWTG